MKGIGLAPRFRPRSLPDRVLAWALTAAWLLCYAPMRLLTRLLGWTRLDWLLLDLMAIPGHLAMKLASLEIRLVNELLTRPLPAIAPLSYPNGGFSQGLVWDGTFLYEAVNCRGTDRIDVFDIATAVRARDSSRIRRVGSLVGPAGSIEDLATDGATLWTSDEETFRFYALEGLDRLRQR